MFFRFCCLQAQFSSSFSLHIAAMEALPDEIWLLVFVYLKKFDLFYAFGNLNQRFQRIIHPHFYEIDLTQAHISYRQFCYLRNTHILNHIRCLTLDAKSYLNLLHPYTQDFTNLNTLTILKYDRDANLLEKFLLLPSLIELSISSDQPSIELLHTIANLSTRNLTRLNFPKERHSRYKYAGTLSPPDLKPMLNVKCLTIGLISNKTLCKIFKIIPNIEELTFSLIKPTDLEKDEEKQEAELDTPVTLKKLQIELRCDWSEPSFESVIKLFQAFGKSNIRSLTLIVDIASHEYANYKMLHSLTSNFRRLEDFSYCIHTTIKPDVCFPNVTEISDPNSWVRDDISYLFHTWPKPIPHLIEVPPFKLLTQHNNDKQVITFEQILNCKSFEFDTAFSLEKDVSIDFHPIDKNRWRKIIDQKTSPDHSFVKNFNDLFKSCTYSVVSKTVSYSPNIHSVHLQRDITPPFIIYLKTVPFDKRLRQTTDFHIDAFSADNKNETSCRTDPSESYLDDLSEILPDIECLTIFVTNEQNDINDVVSFLGKMKKLFHSLTHLQLTIDDSLKTADVVLEILKNKLNEIIRNDENSLYYTEIGQDIQSTMKQLHIWL